MILYQKKLYDHIYPKTIFSSSLFICGLYNNTSPSIKTDLKEAAGDAIKEMQQQVTDFAKAKADTMKQTVKDTLNSIKTEAVNELKANLKNQLLGSKDSTTVSVDSTKKKAQEKIKNTLNGLFNKKKKATDGK